MFCGKEKKKNILLFATRASQNLQQIWFILSSYHLHRRQLSSICFYRSFCSFLFLFVCVRLISFFSFPNCLVFRFIANLGNAAALISPVLVEMCRPIIIKRAFCNLYILFEFSLFLLSSKQLFYIRNLNLHLKLNEIIIIRILIFTSFPLYIYQDFFFFLHRNWTVLIDSAFNQKIKRKKTPKKKKMLKSKHKAANETEEKKKSLQFRAALVSTILM